MFGVMVMVPLYVPAVVKPVGVTDTVKAKAFRTLRRAAGGSDRQPAGVLVLGNRDVEAAPPVLVTLSVCVAGAAPPS